MRKNIFSAIDHISALNEFRKYSIGSGDIPLTESDVRDVFKRCGIPSNSLFFSEFKKSGLLVKVERDLYVWKNQRPIHYQVLQNIYERYQKRLYKYRTTYYHRRVCSKKLLSKEIKNAINLLKENGFEVVIPCGELYKKL